MTELADDDLVARRPRAVLRLVRAQETELPREVEIGFTEARRTIGGPPSHRAALSAAPRARAMPIRGRHPRAEAQRLADAWLQDLWAGRETAEFELARRHLAVEAGDMLVLPTEAGPRLHRVIRIADALARRIVTRAAEPSVFDAAAGEGTKPVRRPPLVAGAPQPIVLDLPVARGEPAVLQYLAVAADPWPGAVAVWRSNDADFVPSTGRSTCRRSSGARSGRSLPARSGVGTRRTRVAVALARGMLASVPDEEALGGANLFAVQGRR